MSEMNWAMLESGARIAEGSFEAANGVNGAANLLRAREDALWLAGAAPQRVTLRLVSDHPPLSYAGWHVWLDSPTNPKLVEIAAGPSLQQLQAILVCEAQPSAGTQVWKLPRAIPADHAFVRFTILESFRPGPTYMNTLVLLEKDPGPDYSANGEALSITNVSLKAADPAYPMTTSAMPVFSRFASASGGGGAGGNDGSPSAHTPPPPDAPAPPAGINTSTVSRRGGGGGSYSDDGRRSDVGAFVATSTTAATRSSNPDAPLQPPSPVQRGCSSRTRSPRARSSSRMSQLLRDLDDDIKQLRPLKTVSPGKNMLVHLSREPSGLQAENLDDRFTTDHSGAMGSDDSDDEKRRHGHRRHDYRDKVNESDGDDDGEGSDKRGVRHSHGGGGSADPRLHQHQHPALTDMALYPVSAAPPPPYAPAAGPAINATYEARLNALEQAVAALNEAVQHQRDDLTMIKRLLLQQAAERRKEAEQRFEEKHRCDHAFSAAFTGSGAMVVPSPPRTPAAAAAAAAAVPGFAADQRLTHRSITVDFPEDALRAFVESVLDKRLRKHTKKVEAKLLQRLDKQLHDVIKVLSATVDGQLANSANVAATTAASVAAAAASTTMSTPTRSIYTEQVGASTVDARKLSVMSSSSAVHGVSGNDCGRGEERFSPYRGGIASSSASSKGNFSHTPRSQTETGMSASGPQTWSGKQ